MVTTVHSSSSLERDGYPFLSDILMRKHGVGGKIVIGFGLPDVSAVELVLLIGAVFESSQLLVQGSQILQHEVSQEFFQFARKDGKGFFITKKKKTSRETNEPDNQRTDKGAGRRKGFTCSDFRRLGVTTGSQDFFPQLDDLVCRVCAKGNGAFNFQEIPQNRAEGPSLSNGHTKSGVIIENGCHRGKKEKKMTWGKNRASTSFSSSLFFFASSSSSSSSSCPLPSQ